ncbi:MAG: S41 family peptidase [Acidobacteriota bacterium]|nr:MAG: S41 family peptidase [Acidobacteriota bacterium]
MRKALLLFLLLPVALSASLSAQEGSAERTTGEEVEPFRISRGQSFSASPGGDSGRSKGAPAFTATQALVDYREALELVLANHVSGAEADTARLTKSAIESMLLTLDPHSNYFDPAEYAELLSDQHSEYFGIGASIANFGREGSLATYVVSTFEGSPAHRAGLRFGDRIVAIDGKDVRGRDSLVVRNLVRGPVGSEVTISAERAGSHSLITVKLRRTRVPQPSIPDFYMVNGTVGYVDLSAGFNYTTSEELDVALRELSRKGMRSLILDLRDNTGGILEQAVHVAGKFLPKGTKILSQKGRLEFDNREWSSRSRTELSFPLIVLVNEDTASASEIVAGALQDHDRALIVGDRTFGKGLVQSVIDLPYGAGLTLTTAKYYTPSGRLIQRDYSNVGLYDYYNHKSILTEGQEQRYLKKTAGGRPVFGGDGIRPDEVVKAESLNAARAALLDPIFLFSRELAAGYLPGLGAYKISDQVHYSGAGTDREFEITADVHKAFREYAATLGDPILTASVLEREEEFISERLRFNLYSAAYGNVVANRVLNSGDPQILKALDLFPKARQLASRLNPGSANK